MFAATAVPAAGFLIGCVSPRCDREAAASADAVPGGRTFALDSTGYGSHVFVLR
jgi:hypothetical protein